MVPEHVAVELEWIRRYRRVDRALSCPRIGRERLPAAATADLVFSTAANEVVIPRIDREEHSKVPVSVHVEHEQIAIVPGTNLNLGPIAGKEAPVVTDPELDCGVVPPRGGGSRIGAHPSEGEGEEESGNHSASQRTAVTT